MLFMALLLYVVFFSRFLFLTPSHCCFSLHPVCDELHPCEGLGRYATFKNFGMAFLLLFRVSTGDNWNGIMKVKLKFHFWGLLFRKSSTLLRPEFPNVPKVTIICSVIAQLLLPFIGLFVITVQITFLLDKVLHVRSDGNLPWLHSAFSIMRQRCRGEGRTNDTNVPFIFCCTCIHQSATSTDLSVL